MTALTIESPVPGSHARCGSRLRDVVRAAAACCVLALGGFATSSASASTTDTQSGACEPGVDCIDTQGQSIQYVLSSFEICSECATATNGQITAFLGDISHPPAPIAPHPSDAIAHGKLYSPTGDLIAVGRIHPPSPILEGFLFDGHLVPAAGHPPIPVRGSYFVGRLYPPIPV